MPRKKSILRKSKKRNNKKSKLKRNIIKKYDSSKDDIEKIIEQMSHLDVDDISEQMSNMQLSSSDNDEYNELFMYINKKDIGINDIIETDERYYRYLNGINDWTLNGVSYDNIRINIEKYLNIPSNYSNLNKKIKYMKIIDLQLKKALESAD